MSADATPTTRTVRDVLLGLLAELDRVCVENGLAYVATHGTLLGAVRDGGVVEGDDDLDVAMPRTDYDRLVALAAEGAFRLPYLLQTPESDPGFFCGGYARLRDSSTTVIEPGLEGRACNQGMWMDVMPLDDCPLGDAAVERRQRVVRTWQRALYAQTYGLDLRWLWDADPRKLSAYFILADHFGRVGLCRNLRRSCMACRPTGLLTVFCGNYRMCRNRVRYAASNIAAATRVPFEGTTIPVPRNAEDWLLAHYGEGWRDMPAGGASGHGMAMDPNALHRDFPRGGNGDG